MLRYFRSRFCQAKKNKGHQEKERKEKGRKRDGGNICIKGQSRRVADVNLLHPDDAKSRKGSTGRGKGDRGQYREIGDTGGAWQCVSLIIFSYYLSSFINIDPGMLTLGMSGARKQESRGNL